MPERPFRFHLRHAYATHSLAAELSAHAVARLLGRSDSGLVWKRYQNSHLDRDKDGIACEKA